MTVNSVSYAPIPQDLSPSGNTLAPRRITSWFGAGSRPRSRGIAIVVVTFLGLLAFIYLGNFSLFFNPQDPQWASDATSFEAIFLKEDQLPQHNLSAPYPEGKTGRYLRFSNQVWGLGWNNLLQERLLNTILAYSAERAPVFSPFEAWAHPPRGDTNMAGQRDVLKIPYNALLSGPTSGMPWGPNDQHPRAVSQKYWEVVCPGSERRVVNADEVMKQVGRESDGIKMLTDWAKLMRDMPERCVEIQGTQVFDFYLIGSTRILSLWEAFKNHPTVRLLEDSEVVKNGVRENMNKLQKIDGAQRPYIPKTTGTIEGLLGIHIRRGDFRGDLGKDNGHCFNLGRWGATYSGWNQLPELHDKYDPPSREGVEGGQYTPAIREYYLKHCLPTVEQVVSRVRELLGDNHARLSHIFIANNAEDEYLADLRRGLVADGWEGSNIVTSKELELNWQATSVGNAVDMAILSRAEAFIGNGWSSMTSNIVMRRLTTGQTPESTRMW
ncbi:unnamed protein product [Rhizoctonia solani]|uniref:Uncharacterized protein n=1 Tax=Rhizoctonia solani TaxID=456999 RepID=A0A8H3GSV6_9AGAM|nr:unnamed protein product [Rhizoctonia solani]